MSGIYGTVRPANITSADVDIFYSYRPTRNSDGEALNFTQLPSGYLQSTTASGLETSDTKLPGAYNLRLPLTQFREKGFYTVYIRPKEIKTTIAAVGSLATYPDVSGIVLNLADDSNIAQFSASDSLTGYRVEYFKNGNREQFSRLITSSNRCEAINQILTTERVKRYRYSDTGSLIFCTVTPSIASSFKPNDAPYIGAANQEIVLVNTKFNPVMMEIELVEHDADTISTMLEGEQVRDLDHGLITYFDEDRNIYRQYEYKALKDSLGNPAYDVKTKRNDIDTTQDINSILGNN